MNDTRMKKRDKRQYIKVFVRIRPKNNAEKNCKTIVITDEPFTKELVIQENSHEKYSKKFTFDRVFGPSSKQTDVYKEVVSPLLEEVLAGYNCTVFAYGQTGTGKTFTMEGISTDSTLNWQSDTTAGIIPRSLSHLFHELQLLDAHEYTVRVSFLELYNEELFDLLSPNNNASKIRLYEDSSKKGAVIVHGLEEVTVWSKNDVYKILERGLEKKRTAATLMNAQSSRSHTIFSITVHIKETAVEGDELLKIGKLNLVDLAGSENIGRSGSVDQRAREAGSINQSLLTLGRVITALVERAPHVPYRESKLTRLLQESLGGRTKTSIIATISPANINLEETLSTLDYAHRARNITIRPELNQKLSKKLLLKEYTEEIEKLRRELVLSRERNGIYLAHDNYNGMQEMLCQQRKDLGEKLKRIQVLEESLQNNERIFNELSLQHDTQTNELHKTKGELSNVTHALQSTKDQLKLTEHNREEQKHIMEKHVSTEKLLLSQANTLLNIADTATADIDKLHDKIDRKTQVEKKNESVGDEFRQSVGERIQGIEKDLSTYKEKLQEFCMSTKNDVDTQITAKRESLCNAIHRISMNLTQQHLAETDSLKTDINNCYKDYQNRIQDEMKHTTGILGRETESLDAISVKFAPIMSNFVKNEIGMNLQLLNNNISHKFDNISAYVKQSVDVICKHRLEDCDDICKRFEEIKKDVDNLLLRRYEVIEKRRMFTKLMEDTFKNLDLLTKSDEESYSVLASKLNGINKNCNSVRVEAIDSCNTNINLSKRLETKVETDLSNIKDNVAASKKKQSEEIGNVIERCNSVVNELKLVTTARSNDLKQYKDFVECDGEDMSKTMDEDKREVLFSMNDINNIVMDASSNHIRFMEELKVNTSRIAEETNNRLEYQVKEIANCHNKVTENSQILEDHINKFLVEDMKRDLPTGVTPIRKQFSYPRQFNETSPHERILQRFREARKVIETSEDEDDMLMSDEITVTEVVNSTALPQSSVINSVTKTVKNTTFNIEQEFNDKTL